MMPRQIGDKVQDRISFTFSPINLRDVQKAMDKKEFANVASLINTAIRFYFDNYDRPSQKDEVKEWLVSGEGEDYIKNLIRKVRDKK